MISSVNECVEPSKPRQEENDYEDIYAPEPNYEDTYAQNLVVCNSVVYNNK